MKKFMTIVAALMLGAALMTGCGAAKKRRQKQRP